MTDYAIYQSFAADSNGNVVSGASVEVRSETTGNLATIFSTRTGTAKANPFTADSDGYFFFHAAGDYYKVRIYTGPSGAPTSERIFRYVPVGLAAGLDTDQLADAIEALIVSGGVLAPLASPVFTGNPTAPTPTPGDNDTSLATTGFVKAAIDAAIAASVGVIPATQGRLTFVSTTSARFDRYNGKYLFINGVNETIPQGGITVSPTGLSPSTVYYAYCFMSNSPASMALELSATVPVFDASQGVWIKTGDATRTQVGRVTTDANSPALFWETNDLGFGVQSKYNPRRLFRVDYHMFGPIAGLGYAIPDGTGNGTYVFLTGTTAQALNYIAVGGARLVRCLFRVIWACNTTANKVRLVHADDGPANITQIAALTSTNGGVANDISDVETSVNAVIDGTSIKSLLMQVDKANGTTFTLYRVCLECSYELDP